MEGLRISARSQVTLRAQGGGVEDDVTIDQSGSPERLCCVFVSIFLCIYGRNWDIQIEGYLPD